MKSPLKIIRNIIIAILILVIVLVVAIKLYANRAIKWGIETAGTKTLNVGVKVDSVKLGIMSGSLGLTKLIIDNPKEYQNPHLLELGSGKILVNTNSLLSDIVKIKEIKLDGVNVTLEQKDVRGNNIQDVLKNIPSSEKTEPSGKKLHIEILEISNINVNVKLLPIPGKADTLTLPLDKITLTNLGEDNKLDTAQLVGKILAAITAGIAKEGAGVLPDDVIGTLNTSLKQLGQLSETLLKGGEQLQKKAKDITEGIKDLIKPKKEEK
jgi:hypothetical protein